MIFDSKTRIAKPIPFVGLKDIKNDPQFSQTFGLMLFNENDYQIDFIAENKRKDIKKTAFSRFFTWLDQYI